MNRSQLEVKKIELRLAGIPVAEIVWALLSIASLGTLLRCLAC